MKVVFLIVTCILIYIIRNELKHTIKIINENKEKLYNLFEINEEIIKSSLLSKDNINIEDIDKWLELYRCDPLREKIKEIFLKKLYNLYH